MKKIWGAALAVLSLAVIVSGNFYYDYKLSAIAEEAQNQNLLTTQYTASEEPEDTQDEQNDEAENSVEEDEAVEEEPVVDLDQLLPVFAESISAARESGEELKIAVYASEVMLGIADEGQLWPEMIDDKFSELFHDISYEIAVYSAGELNTVDLIQSADYERVTEDERHLVILESMLWNDNGQVNNEQSLEYIDMIKSSFEQAGSDVVTVLSPPAYQTVNYPGQIDDFSNYAENNDWLLADHWTYWPALSDDALLEYVDAESRYLTQAGHRVVADSVLDVLGINQ